MNYFLGIDTATNVLAADFEEARRDGPGSTTRCRGTTAITNNVWHHAAATYDGTTWKLYLDGRLDATLTSARQPACDSIQHAALGTRASTPTGAAAAASSRAPRRGAGLERRPHRARRSAPTRTSSSPSPTAGLRPVASRRGTGTSVADSSGNGNSGTLIGGPPRVAGTASPRTRPRPRPCRPQRDSRRRRRSPSTWTANGEADLAGYNVYRDTEPGDTAGTPLNGADLLDRAVATPTRGLTNGTTYYYAIFAVDGSNNSSGAVERPARRRQRGDPVLRRRRRHRRLHAHQERDDGARSSTASRARSSRSATTSTTNGTAAEFANCYDPTWGAFKDAHAPGAGQPRLQHAERDRLLRLLQRRRRCRPARPAIATSATTATTSPATPWHVVVLNSECEPSTGLWLPDGCAAGSAQEQWLRGRPRRPRRRTTSSRCGTSRGTRSTRRQHLAHAAALAGALRLRRRHRARRPLAQLRAAGADGRERRSSTPTFGIRQFVVGTGGAIVAGFGTIRPTSEVRNGTTHGVMKFTLHASSYDWQFIPRPGQTFTDAGTAAVHGRRLTRRRLPSRRLGRSRLARPSDPSTDITWHANENGAYSVRVGGTNCADGHAGRDRHVHRLAGRTS